MPKENWSSALNQVAENTALRATTESDTWQILLDYSDTFYKCGEGYSWATRAKNEEVAGQFYRKMAGLAKTFEHKKKLAHIAQERGDETVSKDCINSMIKAFVVFKDFPVIETLKRRGRSILRMLPADDPRRDSIEMHLASL